MRGPSSGAIEVFLMKKVGDRPRSRPVSLWSTAQRLSIRPPRRSQGGRLSALSWGSAMPAKPALARRRRRHMKRCLVGH